MAKTRLLSRHKNKLIEFARTLVQPTPQLATEVAVAADAVNDLLVALAVERWPEQDRRVLRKYACMRTMTSAELTLPADEPIPRRVVRVKDLRQPFEIGPGARHYDQRWHLTLKAGESLYVDALREAVVGYESAVRAADAYVATVRAAFSTLITRHSYLEDLCKDWPQAQECAGIATLELPVLCADDATTIIRNHMTAIAAEPHIDG